MASVLNTIDWAGLMHLILICAGAMIIAMVLIDRLFPSQHRRSHPPATTTDPAIRNDQHIGEGGVLPDQNPFYDATEREVHTAHDDIWTA